MEPYERLKSLPDAEKAKCFEVFLESIKLASDDSGGSENTVKKTLSIETLLSNLSSGHNISSEGRARKKQKTLDSWLIKPKNFPSHQDKTGESSCMLEESTAQRLNVDSIQPTLTNLNDANSSNSSKNIESPPESTKHILSGSDKVNKNFVKSVQTSEKYNLRSKRKSSEPLLSKHKSPIKSFIDIDVNKSNREKTNKCDANQDVYPNISDHDKNQVCKTDCLKVDNLNSCFNKISKDQISRKNKSNIQNSVQSGLKFNNVTKHNYLDNNDTILSPQNEIKDASDLSLSNCEAFHILEAECSRINLNIFDLLQDKNIQSVLNNPDRIDNETIFLINSFKSTSEKTLPVVHVVESKKRLCEKLKKLQKSV